jgi:hypothetical protein
MAREGEKMRWRSLALIVAICAAVVAAVTIALLYFVQSPCGENEQGCIREWFSAVGSWVGSIATIATLFFLVDQHRQLTKASQRQSEILCDTVEGSCDEMTKPLIAGLAASLSFNKGPAAVRHLDIEECRQSLLRLQMLLSRETHDDFSHTIGDTGEALAKGRDTLADAIAAIKDYGGNDVQNLAMQAVQAAFVEMTEAFSAVTKYRDRIEEAVRVYRTANR